MSVYAEWHWWCETCKEGNEEPYGDPDTAEVGLKQHRREAGCSPQEEDA